MMNLQFANTAFLATASQSALSRGTQFWGGNLSQVQNSQQSLFSSLGQSGFNTWGQSSAIGGFFQAGNSMRTQSMLGAPQQSGMAFAQSMSFASMQGSAFMSGGFAQQFPAPQQPFMGQVQTMVMQMMDVLMKLLQGVMQLQGQMKGKTPIKPNTAGRSSAEVDDKPAPKPRPRSAPTRSTATSLIASRLNAQQSSSVRQSAIEREGGDGGGDGGDGGDGDPLAFDLNRDGRIGVTGASTAQRRNFAHQRGRTVEFDLDGDGIKDRTEWMAGDGDGLLIDDRDGKAAENMDGTRLFGDEGGKYKDGIAKLKRHDLNNDGKISGEELKGLKMWIDDGDAKVEEGEMKTLEELGIKEISVERNVVKNEFGEDLMRSTATTVDGEKLMTEDVWFDGDFSKKGELGPNLAKKS